MKGIAVLAISSDEIKFGIGYANDITSDTMHSAGTRLARTTIADFGDRRRQAFVLFTDGLLENNSLIVRGIKEIFGKIFPIVGAGSSDNFSFKETYQYFQDQAMRHSATALLLGGQTQIAVGSKHGWKPLGKPRFITETEGHIIKKIDDEKASNIYEEYFGVHLDQLHAAPITRASILYPLGVYIEGEKEYLLRYAVEIKDDGSIVCQGEVPQGAEVHLMISNKDFCKQAAIEAATEIRDAFSGKKPKVVLMFESVSRNKLLGRGSLQEIQLMRDILGYGVPIIGMYSYGEIAPLKSLIHMGESYLQNQTIVMVGIG